jgi:hypothetical protein
MLAVLIGLQAAAVAAAAVLVETVEAERLQVTTLLLELLELQIQAAAVAAILMVQQMPLMDKAALAVQELLLLDTHDHR